MTTFFNCQEKFISGSWVNSNSWDFYGGALAKFQICIEGMMCRLYAQWRRCLNVSEKRKNFVKIFQCSVYAWTCPHELPKKLIPMGTYCVLFTGIVGTFYSCGFLKGIADSIFKHRKHHLKSTQWTDSEAYNKVFCFVWHNITLQNPFFMVWCERT